MFASRAARRPASNVIPKPVFWSHDLYQPATRCRQGASSMHSRGGCCGVQGSIGGAGLRPRVAEPTYLLRLLSWAAASSSNALWPSPRRLGVDVRLFGLFTAFWAICSSAAIGESNTLLPHPLGLSSRRRRLPGGRLVSLGSAFAFAIAFAASSACTALASVPEWLVQPRRRWLLSYPRASPAALHPRQP